MFFSSYSRTVVALAVFASMTWCAYRAAIACENERASTNVGACIEPDQIDLGPGITAIRCKTFDGYPSSCENCHDALGPDYKCVDIKEDFPTSCVEQNNSNCNEPLADCWGVVNCRYVDGECKPIPESVAPWHEKKKRTTVACTTAT